MNITDMTRELPRHGSKVYPKRKPEQIKQIVIHHTAGPANQPIPNIASYHVRHNGWPGIAYHYMIGADGQVYLVNHETNISYHAKGANTKSLGICFIGDYTKEQPTDSAIAACRQLIAELKERIPSIEKVIPHKDVHGSSTACPGDSFPMDRLLAEDTDLLADLKLLYDAAVYYDAADMPNTRAATAAFNRIRRLPGMPPIT